MTDALDVFHFGARLALAIPFFVAGASKLVDLGGTSRTLEAFGVPRKLARVSGLSLAVLEVVAALALASASAAELGALLALGLVVLFIAVVVFTLASGRRPDCGCYGSKSRPITWRTVVRNVALAGIAGWLVTSQWPEPGRSLLSGLAQATATEKALVLAGSIGAFLLTAAAGGDLFAPRGARPAAALGPPVDLPVPVLVLTPLIATDGVASGSVGADALAQFPAAARPLKAACALDDLQADGSIVLNGCGSAPIHLTAFGTLMWECCDGAHDLSALVAELREVDRGPAEGAIKHLLDLLLRSGLVVIAPAEPVAAAAEPAAARTRA